MMVVGSVTGCALLGWKLWARAERRKRNANIAPNSKIVVLGAGFAGLNVAQGLSKLLQDEIDAQIVLIDQDNFLIFTPMLTEVAGGELDPRHVLASVRRLSPRIDFIQGRVQEIDLKNKCVTLRLGPEGGTTREIKGDQLVIALGSVPNFHGIPGVEENSLNIKTVANAAAIHTRVLNCLERANWEPDANVRREILTFVVGGGGYTGVETMAAVNDFVRESVRHYPRLTPEDISTIIVEPSGRILPELSPDLAAFAHRKLEQNAVQILLNTKITCATDTYVEVEGGKKIGARTLIWAGGVAPNPLIQKLDCKRSQHGAILVDECCAVQGYPGVWALGDCAQVPRGGSSDSYAPTAQNATREGTLVAKNVVAVLRGEHPSPFSFRPIGELALVGRHAGVAKIYGHHFSGFLAWAMWRAIYLSKMPGASQRARILLDWVLDFVFGRSTADIPINSSASQAGK
jgi:NADH dehydrogenase